MTDIAGGPVVGASSPRRVPLVAVASLAALPHGGSVGR
jgi:hypothetical protein